MREKRRLLTGPLLLFLLAAVLLLISTVGSTRAALTYYSDYYEMQVNVSNIDVALLENGRSVEGENTLLADWFGDGENQTRLIPGEHYEETLAVQNTGAIDTYVRVILYRSWKQGGRKITTLSPELIRLGLGTDNGWILDESASASEDQYQERLVLYYQKPLAPGQVSEPFCSRFWLDSAVYEAAETAGEQGTYKTSFLYGAYSLDLDAEVNVVQTHDAENAIRSAWGVDVNIAEDGTLSL